MNEIASHNNLHLCLALPNNTYYEDLVIDVEDIEGKGKGELKFKNGMYSFREQAAGVGIEYDQSELENISIQKYEKYSNGKK